MVAVGAAVVYSLQRQVLHGWDLFSALELVDYAGLPGVWFGAMIGAAAELSELPNSFVKRRLSIDPGATARGIPGGVFFLWDQLDVLLGFWLVFAPVVPVTPVRMLASMLIVGIVHPLFTVAGYLLRMRPTPR